MDVDPRRLSHWARVAFAARCARRVRPLFDEAWPDAGDGEREAVDRAIALAEQSVVQGRACDGLKDAVLGALMTAGSALIPQRRPAEDGDAAVVASLAAKVAEKAAEAALADPRNSGELTWECYHFAVDVIHAAGHLVLLKTLAADFAAAERASSKTPWWRLW